MNKKVEPPFRMKAFDKFYAGARQLRQEFEQIQRADKSTDGRRFVWDYWHVPGQYTQLRTPAYNYFAPKHYQSFHEHLVLWGRRMLGCHDITPTWLSAYVHGCQQDFHVDLPHGPFAFVYSLTPWQARKFSGGATMLLREETLNYWERFSETKSERERTGFVETVSPEFNRLVLFDPRIPHGVEEVRGVQNILEGRLVIHGWFVEPRPFIEGSLAPKELAEAIPNWLLDLERAFAGELPELSGISTFRLKLGSGGEVSQVKPLISTLRSPALDERSNLPPLVQKTLEKAMRATRFSRKAKGSLITLPFVFTRS